MKEKAQAANEVKTIPLDENNPEQTVKLSGQLDEAQYKKLLGFLNSNKDAFAWSAQELCGANRDIIEHKLNIDP